MNLENDREIYSTSVISSEISEFFCFCSPNENFDKIPAHELQLIASNGKIQWSQVNDLFDDISNENLQSKEYCATKIEQLNEVLLEVFLFWYRADDESIERLIEDYAAWTFRVNDLLSAKLDRNGADTKFAFDTLVYTSILEFSLGNVSQFQNFLK